MSDKENTGDALPEPHERMSLAGHSQLEISLRKLLDQNALNNGWMLTGPSGIGKATLAYRIARGLLSKGSLTGHEGLAVNEAHQSIRLVNQKAHPDLFLAERQWDEKKQRYATEISVEVIRNLISSLSRTSNSGARVAIVDTADNLNRNAANALLKVLEEPPTGTTILLLVNSPGHILPTIRSRCRVLHLHPVTEAEVASFLQAETDLTKDQAIALARTSDGRPGYALQLAREEGMAAMALVESFLQATTSRTGFQEVADKLAPKSAESLWSSFRTMLLQKMSQTVRQNAAGSPEEIIESLQSIPHSRLLKAWEELKELIDRGEALNSDRGQLVLIMGIRTKSIFNGAA